jgi:hypothetical protein
MRLAIVTGIWKRPEIFRMFAAGVQMLQDHFRGRVEIVCCVAGSEGMLSRNLVGEYRNFFYVETPNQPLGQKMNQAAHLASRLSPNYCLMLGSDDLIGIPLMEKYYVAMQQGIDYTVLMDCYFFDTVSKRGLYWGGYTKAFNRGRALGMGRLISARMLNQLRWVCWPPGYDKILDTAFDKQMDRTRCSRQAIILKNEKLFALDIKSSVNMTEFRQWDNSEFMDGKKLLFDNLPHNLAQQIYGNDL